MLILFWLSLSIIATGLTSKYYFKVDRWQEFWIPLVSLICFFIAIAVVFYLLAYIFGVITVNKKKEYKKISKFHAFLFDKTVVIEKVVDNLKEYNVSAIGNELKCELSDIEEVIIKKDFLLFL